MNYDEKYQRWLHTGENPDGKNQSVILIYIHEKDGILLDEVTWNVYGDTALTPINAKRIRKAAINAYCSVLEELDNLDKP